MNLLETCHQQTENNYYITTRDTSESEPVT